MKHNEISQRQRCLFALEKAPATAEELGAAIGATPASVSGLLSTLYFDGVLDRESTQPGGVPHYRYTFNVPPKSPREKPERKHRASPKKQAKIEDGKKAEAEKAEAEKAEAEKAEAERKENELVDMLATATPDNTSVEQYMPPAPPKDFEDLMTRLASSIADRLIAQVFTNVAARLPEAFSSIGEAMPSEAKVVKVALPKVAVVGLLPEQAVMIENEYRDKFTLTFPNRDDARALKSAAYFNEVVFLMTKFVGHSAQNKLTSSGAKLSLIHGGMSDLRHHLSARLNG